MPTFPVPRISGRLRLPALALAGLAASACASRMPARTADTAPMPDAVVVRVERVTVAALRPSTTDHWDGPARDTNGAECRLLEAGATALASPLGGAALGALCDLNAPPQQERAPENPDLQVRLSAGNTHLDSFVEPDALDHVFGYEFVVPSKAIPAEGLRVEVLDADAGQAAETIGVQRLTAERLAGILSSPTGMADLPDGAAQHLEIAVSPYTPMKFDRSQQRASDGPRGADARAAHRTSAGASLYDG